MDRMFPNICSSRLVESRDFYVAFLAFAVEYDSDWFIHLRQPDDPRQELGIISQDSDLVPEGWRRSPSGLYLTFVVADVDAAHARARDLGVEIVQPPKDEFYGQRRFLAVDPNGCLLDISAPVSAPSA